MHKISSYNFKKLNENYLISNEYGFYEILNKKEFDSFKKAFFPKKIIDKQFSNNKLDLELIHSIYFKKYNFDWKGPHTHIISITGKCNQSCLYCSASSSDRSKDMSFKTAKRIIDFIFSIENNEFFIEFTGGEPTSNLDILTKIFNYAKEKSKKTAKSAYFSVVTNLSYRNEKIIDFFIKNNITVCSSLDGPKEIHDKNRIKNAKGSSYEDVIYNIKLLKKAYHKGLIEKPNLISTITSLSLNNEKKIIDEYVKNGIYRIQLGMAEPIGRALINKELLIDDKEYLKFYRNSIDYILFLNIRKKIPVYEKGLKLLLYDILNFHSASKRSVDIYNRLAYDYDGNIYPSDELRLIGENGDKTFSLGNVFDDDFKDLLSKDIAKLVMLYQLNKYLLPYCFHCPYNNWCRVPLYYNYASQKSLWGNMLLNQRCSIFRGIFDMIFELLENKKYKNVLTNSLDDFF